MKLLHLGDLHLGKSLNDFDLIEDQRYILDQILDIIQEQNVKGVLLAGDIYDKSVPSEAATNLLDYFLRRLVDLQVAVYMISGNHDSDDRLNFGSSLFSANRIFIAAKYDGTMHKYTAEDENGEVNIYLLPFVKMSQVRHFYPEAEIETYEDAVRCVIENTGIDKSARNVIVAHQFVAGKGAGPRLGGSEGPAVQNVGLVEQIGYQTFDLFDYAALGHIHSPQSVGRDEVRYSGSMLKYSLSEVHSEKSVPVITMGKKGEVEIECIPLVPRRDLRHIKGELKTLLAREKVESPDDYMYVTLTDEDMIENAGGIIRQTYPNTVKIDYENSHTKNLEEVDLSQIGEEKPFDEVFRDFYRLMYGCEISEEEMSYLMDVAKEAGIE